ERLIAERVLQRHGERRHDEREDLLALLAVRRGPGRDPQAADHLAAGLERALERRLVVVGAEPREPRGARIARVARTQRDLRTGKARLVDQRLDDRVE